MSNNTTNHRCGDCVNMRKEDGYCPRLGRHVNYFRVVCKDYVDRIEAAEKEALASMPEPEEPEVRVKADAKIRRKALLHPDPKPGTRVCKQCGRELPLEQFTRSCKSRDGYTHTCKECRKAEGRAVYERNCAKKGITQKPPRMDAALQPLTVAPLNTDKFVTELFEKQKDQMLRTIKDEELVAELRRRGYTVTATKEL